MRYFAWPNLSYALPTPPYPISLSRPHFPPQRAAHHVLALHVLPTFPNFFLRSVDACTAASALIRWPRPRPPVLFGQVRPDWPAGSDHGDWAARPVAGRTGLGTLVLSLIRNDRVLRGHVCVSIGDGADIEVEMQRIGDLGLGRAAGELEGCTCKDRRGYYGGWTEKTFAFRMLLENFMSSLMHRIVKRCRYLEGPRLALL